MYRHRIHAQIRFGHFNDYLALSEQLNELARSRLGRVHVLVAHGRNRERVRDRDRLSGSRDVPA